MCSRMPIHIPGHCPRPTPEQLAEDVKAKFRAAQLTDPCPACRATGQVAAAVAPGYAYLHECPDCLGVGKLRAGYAARREAGLKLRKERLAVGLGLREFCLARGLDPVKRSRQERGIE